MSDPSQEEVQERIDFNNRLKKFKEVQDRIKKTTPNGETEDIDWAEAGQALKEQEIKETTVITTADLLNITFPEINWLVEGLIPSEGFTALTGTPASYKSFLTEHLAICLSMNQPFLGHFPVNQGAVFIIDKENPLSLLQERFQKLGASPDAPIYFLQDPDHYKLQDEEHLKWTIEFIKEKKIKLVILDSFVHIHRGDENDSQAIAETFEKLKLLPCAVVFIHHHRKTIKFFTGTPLESIRGSSDIAAEVESHLAVDQVPSGLRIAQYKNRRGELVKPFTVSPIATETSMSFSYAGEITEEVSKAQRAEELIIELLISSGELARKQIIEALSGEVGERNIDSAIKQMIEKEEIIVRYEGKAKFISMSQSMSQTATNEISLSEESYLEEADNMS